MTRISSLDFELAKVVLKNHGLFSESLSLNFINFYLCWRSTIIAINRVRIKFIH